MRKLREEIIQNMYDTIINEDLDYGVTDKHYDSILKNAGISSEYDVRYDSVNDAVCVLEHDSFFAGANMVLDFISGREVYHD